jgi:D-beta-D-heptose 7-phosphate kinase/D-beta-D-heptose 1-phosphate adenosyltransferase
MLPDFSEAIPRLQRLIPRLRGRRIGVLGDLMLDRYLWGHASKLSPEAPVPVVDFAQQTECLGGAGNVAANLAALGARVEALGVIGSDKSSEAGRIVRSLLRDANIGEGGVVADATRVTTVKTRIIARHQHIVRIDQERADPLRGPTAERLLRTVIASAKTLDALIVSDYQKGVLSDDLVDRVLSACHKLKVPVFVSPKRSRLYALRGAKAIVCNVHEAEVFVTHPLENQKAIEEAGRQLLAHFGCGAVLITRGRDGMSLFEEGEPRHLDIPATNFEVTYARIGQPGVERGSLGRQVFDVTGASDTVLSVFTLAAAAGASLPDAALLANIAAGVVVGKLGTATVSPKELQNTIEDLGR